MKRLLGFIIFLTGLVLLLLAFAGAYFVGDVLDELAEGVTTSLDMASQSLESAKGTLELTKTSVSDVTGGLATAIEATTSASVTLNDSRPLIDNVSTVTTQEVPEAVEGIQAALPNLIQVASIIDTTLVTLSSVGIDRDIPLPFGGSIPLRFDLGIDYDPETSFDESLRVFDLSLVGLPESLRGLEDDLQATSENLGSLSGNLSSTAENLTTINTRLGELVPLLEGYSELVDQLNETLAQVESQLEGRLQLVRLGLIALLIAVGLSQLTSIYLGWELMAGRRQPQPAPMTPVKAVEYTPTTGHSSYEDPSNTAVLPLPAEAPAADRFEESAHGQS